MCVSFELFSPRRYAADELLLCGHRVCVVPKGRLGVDRRSAQRLATAQRRKGGHMEIHGIPGKTWENHRKIMIQVVNVHGNSKLTLPVV
jgi:hypothetical protein